MKQILVFIALALFSFCLTACDKDIVVSEPHVDDFDGAYIMVYVKDDMGYAIPNVEIKLVFYPSLDDAVSYGLARHADEKGKFRFYLYAKEEFETINIFATKEEFEAIKIFAILDGYISIPESYMIRIKDDDQSILCTFTMYENEE